MNTLLDRALRHNTEPKDCPACREYYQMVNLRAHVEARTQSLSAFWRREAEWLREIPYIGHTP